jgi:PAS domain S-box-containing protein
MAPTKILCVDDDSAFLHSLEKILVLRGFRVTAVLSVPQALELISKQHFDVLITDLNIGEPGDGFTIVSAMRRVQPTACTFIVTGFPDFDSAIKAIQNQVDNYFSKPLNIDQLLQAITAIQAGDRPVVKKGLPLHVSELIRNRKSAIIQESLRQALRDPEIAAIPLSDGERVDHLPAVLDQLVERLENQTHQLSKQSIDAARKHGKTRQQQGYTIPHIIFETRILQQVLSETIQNDLLSIELSSIVPDTFEIGETLQAALEISIRAYQSQAPHSLQMSFSNLYNSPYLGVLIADENRIIDANDAFLEMIGHSRDQLRTGGIDWSAMTPEEFRALDLNAVQQLREFGTCVPFEKAFLLPNGKTLPFLIGAIRLSIDPLQWSAFVIDLTKQRRLREIERKIRDTQSRHLLINQLAHEINNPLAALVFTLHLLGTHSDLSTDARELVQNADVMLNRLSETVKKVLVETRAEAAG